MKSPALFIDRDGTIIKQIDGHYISSIEQIELIENIFPAILMLQNEGYLVIIVTNQAGINKGILSNELVDEINQHIIRLLKKQGIDVSAVYVCPHKPEEQCKCRKPQPGLLLKAAKEHNIDLENSIIIGDTDKDTEAGLNAGLKKVIKI
ncbi:MAG: HAD family hydrolase [Nitrososphaerales archaeon]|nr:HAD family hydrolase [Nitrososphaerales archaeon]